jgi:site-specific DNA-methyltransferase (adenine-specific)
MSNVHFSSQRLDWRTPKALYAKLDDEFSFDHDPSPADNRFDYRRNNGQELLELFGDEFKSAGIKDGLASEWGVSNFVNPPYGKELPKWIAKGYEQWQKGKTVVFLIPSRTDTRWWHDYCMKADEIRFIKGRLKFDDRKNSAPFPSAIVIFRGSNPIIGGKE